MKRKALALTTALLAGVMAAPAYAFIQGETEINKYVNVYITEDVYIHKYIYVYAELNVEATGAAEASAYVNVTNLYNAVNPDIFIPDWDTDRDADITDSITDNVGIVGVNQDLGDMNNQANVVAIAYTEITGGIAHAEGGSDQLNHLNSLSPREDEWETGQGGDYNPFNVITGSINFNNGVVGVNQNSGSMNNQTNSVAVAGAENPIVALSDANLGQVNASNYLNAFGTQKRNEIVNSVSNNTGIVQVNQSGGHMNNQASAMSLAVGLDSANVSNAIGGLTSF